MIADLRRDQRIFDVNGHTSAATRSISSEELKRVEGDRGCVVEPRLGHEDNINAIGDAEFEVGSLSDRVERSGVGVETIR